MHKKLCFLPVLFVLALALSGCSNTTSAQSDQTSLIPASSLTNNSSGDQAVASSANDGQATQPTNNTLNSMTSSNQPSMIIDQNKTYAAILHTTAGDIEISLKAKATPITANNFVWLAKKNFYNQTVFHRVIKGFMIQGGDPKGDGTGGPGYSFNDEPFTGDYNRGTVAMANAGPNTNGSQFFIMHQDYPLPKNYVIFGQVTKGLDVVDSIAEAPVKMSASGELSQPVTPIKINSIEIIEK